MAGKVVNIETVLTPDNLGCEISRLWVTWDMYRQEKKEAWKELYKYLYATDTTTTTNSTLPWKNTTTTPKLAQIQDNLFANYMASIFPKRRWMKWEGATDEDDSLEKQRAIQAYMMYVVSYPGFKAEIEKLILDYIQTGNVFATVDWIDERVEQPNKMQSGYFGPVAVRVSAYDFVMNPTAPDFQRSPKIVRSIVSLGELKDLLDKQSADDGEKEAAKELYDYLMSVRQTVSGYTGTYQEKDTLYQVDGFSSFRNYLESGYCEVLTFYGDIFDRHTGDFKKNHIIQVVDRHKIIRDEPIPSDFGSAQIFHTGWRRRADNLWAMGPLDNLVGLQYRLDHIENSKADFFDLVNFPPLKIKGYVEDFEWGPFEKIFVGDDGDVEIMQMANNPLAANFELDRIERQMEEMAGAPKEAMGIRSPGEKTAYEVQRLENAASRIFQNKIAQFEEQILEPLLNAMLELARRKMPTTTVRVFDDEFNVAAFMSLTSEDVAGAGRFRPVGARHFAEVAERVQNVNNFYASGIGADPQVRAHITSIGIAQLFEELLDLQEYKLVSPYIRMTEEAEAERLMAQNQEDTMMGMATPSGLTPEDSDEAFIA